ncbi:MAG: hypothetical protein WA624_12330 [Methylocella sp.]
MPAKLTDLLLDSHGMGCTTLPWATALVFLDHFLPCAEFGIFRAEAKRVASAFAPTRNWDAFQELVEDGPLTRYAQEGESFAPVWQGVL